MSVSKAKIVDVKRFGDNPYSSLICELTVGGRTFVDRIDVMADADDETIDLAVRDRLREYVRRSKSVDHSGFKGREIELVDDK